MYSTHQRKYWEWYYLLFSQYKYMMLYMFSIGRHTHMQPSSQKYHPLCWLAQNSKSWLSMYYVWAVSEGQPKNEMPNSCLWTPAHPRWSHFWHVPSHRTASWPSEVWVPSKISSQHIGHTAGISEVACASVKVAAFAFFEVLQFTIKELTPVGNYACELWKYARTPLSQRWKFLKLITMYNIVNGAIYFPTGYFVQSHFP